MAANLLKRHSTRLSKCESLNKSSPTSNGRAKEAPARIPVFMLPHTDLATVPEDEEIHGGFLLHMVVRPHHKRRFAGLIALSDVDERCLERSAATSVKFRSFSCIARAA